MKEINCSYTEEIVCPWCGYEYSESYELGDDDTVECDECGKSFAFYRDVEVTYSTEKSKYGICKRCGKNDAVLKYEFSNICQASDVCEGCLRELRDIGIEKLSNELRQNLDQIQLPSSEKEKNLIDKIVEAAKFE